MNKPFDKGDVVLMDADFDKKIGGKEHTILAIKESSVCQSGWLVKISLYKSWLDSNWFTLKTKNNEQPES